MRDFAGLGERIRTRLRQLGYWKHDRPDVLRFCEERRYRPQYVYAWLRGRVPTYGNLTRLAEDLGVPMAWIMFGQEAGVASVEQRVSVERMRHETEAPAGAPLLAPRGPRAPRPTPPAGPGWEPQVLDFKRLREVTERLVQLEAELQAILKAFPDSYFWLGADGRVLSHQGGPSLEPLVPPEGVLGRPLVDVLPDGVRRPVEEALRQALDADAVVAVEFSLPSPERPRSFEARFVPIPAFAEGRRLLAIVRDITERKQTEDATRALVRVGHELAASLDLAQASQRVAEAVLGLFRVRGSALCRLEPDGATMRCVAAVGSFAPDEWTGKSLPVAGTISGLAIAENRPVVSVDVLADPRVELPEWAVASARADGWGAVACVPLTARGRVLGVLTLTDAPGRRFTEEELALLAAFADAAAVAIQNAELYAETERRRQAAESLAEVGHVLSQSLDPQEVAERIVERVLALLEVESSAVFQLEPGSGELVSLALAGSHGVPRRSTVVLPPGAGTSGLAVQERCPVITANVLEDPRLQMTPEIRARTERAGIYSAVSVPLVVRDEVIGALAIGDQLGRVFTPDEVRLVQTFADQAATALQNARLFQESQRKAKSLGATPAPRRRRGTPKR